MDTICARTTSLLKGGPPFLAGTHTDLLAHTFSRKLKSGDDVFVFSQRVKNTKFHFLKQPFK
jgi:diphthamide biosynthesis methyltransferase